MTENETNQRTITEQMNRKESETVGEARPGEERSEVKVKGTCTVAMMAGMATEGSGCAQCSHAACTIQRALRRAVAREWGMPSLIDSKDALGAPWLGLEHAYHNGQCRQNDQWWHTDYMLVGGYSKALLLLRNPKAVPCPVTSQQRS